MATIATLAVALTMKTRKFERGLKRTSRSFQQFGRQLTVMGAGITLAFAGALKSFADYGDEIAKMARRTGLSVQAVAKLGYIAKISGADIGGLEKAVRRMARSISDAKDGLTTYMRAFERVGLNAEELARLSPEQAFMRIARAIAATEDPLVRAAAAQEIFGRSGTMLIPMFDLGAQGIETLIARLNKLGGVLDQETTVKAEQLTDAIVDLALGIKGVATEIATNLDIRFETLSDTIADNIEKIRMWIREHKNMLITTAKSGIGLLVIGGALSMVGLGMHSLAIITAGLVKGIVLLAKAIRVLGVALTWLVAHPLVLAIVAGVLLGVAITKLLDKLGLTHSILEDWAEENRRAKREVDELTSSIKDMDNVLKNQQRSFANSRTEVDHLIEAEKELGRISEALARAGERDRLKGGISTKRDRGIRGLGMDLARPAALEAGTVGAYQATITGPVYKSMQSAMDIVAKESQKQTPLLQLSVTQMQAILERELPKPIRIPFF